MFHGNRGSFPVPKLLSRTRSVGTPGPYLTYLLFATVTRDIRDVAHLLQRSIETVIHEKVYLLLACRASLRSMGSSKVQRRVHSGGKCPEKLAQGSLSDGK